MRALEALLWLDWRSVRRDFLLLCGVASLAPLLLSPLLLGQLGSPGLTLATLAYALLPCACSVLGASLTSDRAALAFLSSRPVSWRLSVTVRLAARCLLGILVAMIGLGSLAAFTSDRGALAAALESRPSVAVGACFLAIGFTSAGAGLGALVGRSGAVAAGPCGWLLFLIGGYRLTELLRWLSVQWMNVQLEGHLSLFAPTLAALPALLAAWLAWMLLCWRSSAQPRASWRGVAKISLAGLAIASLLVLPPCLRAAREVHLLERAIATSPLAGDLQVPLSGQPTAEARAWLEERELAWRQPRRERLEDIAWPLTELRLATAEDRIGALPLDRLRELLAPVREDLSLLASSILAPELSDDTLLAVSNPLEGSDAGGPRLNAALLAHARLLQEDGDHDGAREAFAAAWRLHALLRRSLPIDYYLGAERRALRLQLRAALDGAAVPESLRADLGAIDLRSGMVRDALAGRHRLGTSGSWPAIAREPRQVRRQVRDERERLRVLERTLTGPRCSPGGPGQAVEPRLQAEVTRMLSDVTSTELLAELTARVLAIRAGDALDPQSSCRDARWVQTRRADGSWSLHLENGPIPVSHDEPAPSGAEAVGGAGRN